MDDIENEALHSILQSPLFDIKMKEKNNIDPYNIFRDKYECLECCLIVKF